MKDRIRDWMIAQLRKESVLIKQFSNSELHVLVTGKDFADPLTGEKVEDVWHSFMTDDNPLGAKSYLHGELEHDFNMDDVRRPTKAAMREALIAVLNLDSNPASQDANLQAGFRVKRDKLFVDTIGTMDNIINPESYVERLDPNQIAAIQVQKLLMASGGKTPQSEGREKLQLEQTKQEAKKEEKVVSNPSSKQA